MYLNKTYKQNKGINQIYTLPATFSPSFFLLILKYTRWKCTVNRIFYLMLWPPDTLVHPLSSSPHPQSELELMEDGSLFRHGLFPMYELSCLYLKLLSLCKYTSLLFFTTLTFITEFWSLRCFILQDMYSEVTLLHKMYLILRKKIFKITFFYLVIL